MADVKWELEAIILSNYVIVIYTMAQFVDSSSTQSRYQPHPSDAAADQGFKPALKQARPQGRYLTSSAWLN